MADKEVASSEKTWEKGPPPPSLPPRSADDDAGASSEKWDTEVDAAVTSTDSSIELKSGVIPVYDNVSTTETKASPGRSSYNTNNDSLEREIRTPTGRPVGSHPNGVKQEDLEDSGVSQEDLSQANDSIMQDNMQDIEDRKPNTPELGSDISLELGTDSSYVGLGSPAYARTSLDRSVEATVSETERNGNFARMGSSSRESLSGSCDSNANIKGMDRTAMTRTLTDAQCMRQDSQFQSQENITSNDKCSPNRTENGNGDINSEFVTPEKSSLYRSESEPASQELLARVERRQKYNSTRINPTISLSVQCVNDAMSPPASPTHSPTGTPQMRPRSTGNITMSFIDRKVQEILDTERSYVKDLGDIIQHYQGAMEEHKELDLSMDNFIILFGNLQAIHRFNKELLEELEKCNNDAVEIAECFLEKEIEFSVYTDYCTNYPNAVEVLQDCTKDIHICDFFRKCQISLGHALPLGAYLLKPVQRVLKYHLLFQDMHKHFNVNADGYDVIQDALDAMTFVAHHINEMKRKHEAAVHVQEIQSQMVGLEKDLNSFGDLVLEDVFRLQGARAERYLYLFVKELLIGKKREDGLINVKTHISCSNLMLIDSIHKEPLGFNVIPFDNPTIQYTILSKNQDQKKLWTHEIKRMILENYGSNIPTKVKELILKTTTPEPAKSKSPLQESEEGLSRDKKFRKSRRKKRRNSEPMNKLLAVTTSDPSPTSTNLAMTKLQRGQRQVKAALENILWPDRGEERRMKRPVLNMRRNSEFQIPLAPEVLTDDSLDQDESENTRRKQKSMEDLTGKVRRNSSFTLPSSDASRRSHDGRGSPSILNRRSLEFDSSFSTLNEEDQMPARRISRSRAGSRGNKESNRDSGIGSMTLSEHLKLDLDERGSNDGEKAEGLTEEQGEPGEAILKSHRKKNDSFSKFDTEDDDEDEDATKATKCIDSPDELEALEALDERIDASIVDKGGTFNLDPSPMSPPSDEAFKLRHKDIRNFRRMSSSSQDNLDEEEIWVKMPPSASRGRSMYNLRPLSAEVAGHPHFAKMPLARSSSENFKHLGETSFHLRTHSDPNIVDSQIDKDSDTSSSKDDRSTQPLDSSISTLGASDEFSLSSTSDENLLDSVNSAFKRLGEKYDLKSRLTGEAGNDEDQTKNESDNLEESQSKESDVCRIKRAEIIRNSKKAHPVDAESVRSTHRTAATINVTTNVAEPESTEDIPLSLPKRRVHKLAREFSRRARSLERPSTLVKHRSEPQIRIDFDVHEDESESGSESIGLARKPRGELAHKVQSLKKALDESKEKVSQVKVNSTADISRTARVQRSDSSTSEDDRIKRVSRPTEPVTGGRSRSTAPVTGGHSRPTEHVTGGRSRPVKGVQDKVKQFESLSPKRSVEGKVVTPNASMSIQQRLRTIQESSDYNRRSKSMDRSHFVEGHRTSPNKSPLKSLKERKFELEEWATRPISRGRYSSEGAFLGVACSDAISNDSTGDEKEVFSSRSSRTSSVQSSESGSPLPQKKGMDGSRRWSSHSSSLSEEEQILFKSIKDRFRELEKAVSKPVPRTCKDAKAEIKAIAKTEKGLVKDSDSDDSARCQYEHADIEEQNDDVDTDDIMEEEQVFHADETDSGTLDLQQEAGSSLPEEEEDSKLVAEAVPEAEQELVETGATDVQEDKHDDQDVENEASGSDYDTLKRSKAEELMRELNKLSMATDFESDTIKRCKDRMSRKLDVSQIPTSSTPSVDTKDIPIEEDPRSTSTQYSLELDVIPIEETHLMDHNYQSTSVDDTCVPTRVISKIDIDCETRSEGGLSPERKPFPLERVLSSDSNIFLDARSDLGGSEDSSSQSGLSGFVTPVESFSQE